MEGPRDSGALEWLQGPELHATGYETRHLDLHKLNLKPTEVGLGHVLDLVFSARQRLLHEQCHSPRSVELLLINSVATWRQHEGENM